MSSLSRSTSRASRHANNTGFPDSFASRTTSLRHPDAIVDPGFTISSEHIDSNKSHHRSLMSLLHKHRLTMNSTKSGGSSASSEASMSPTSPTDSTADLSLRRHGTGLESGSDESDHERRRGTLFRKLMHNH